MLIVDLELMKLIIGDLRGYDFEEEKVPAEEIKIDFRGVFRAETPLISPIKSMLQDPIYWYYYRIPLEFNIQVIVDVM